jgi:phospholipid/cholesterol/gamma-HCH transport system ATP-binding protein
LPTPHHNQREVLIRVDNVTKAYNGKSVLNGISFEVHEGEVLAVIGTSGGGKSTILKIIAGLEKPDSGTVTLNNPNYTMVFQYSALFDSLTVLENVAFSLMEPKDNEVQVDEHGKKRKKKQKKYSRQEIRDIVREKLRLVGLEDVEDKFPNQLSGGMQKRVSFARAIVSNPRIILYDEPTAGLDPVAATTLENYIVKLRDELDAASVVVTHDISTILRTADRICLLKEGRVEWSGTPEEFLHTDNESAREFADASVLGLMEGKNAPA